MKKLKDKKWINYILLCIGLIILILFIINLDFVEVKKSLKYINLEMLIVLLILLVVTTTIRGYRWKILIKILTKKVISMKLAMTSMVAGVAAGTLTPGRGLEIAKPLILKGTHGVPLSKSISAMIIEKVFDMVGYISIFAISIIILPKGIYNNIVILGVCLIFLIIFLTFAFPKRFSLILNLFLNRILLPKFLKKKFIKFNRILFTSFSELQGINALWIGLLSIGELFVEVFILYYIFMALNIKIGFFSVVFGLVGAVLISLLTMIPGGIGINEVSQAEILRNIEPTLRSNIGMVKMGILINALEYYLLIILGIFILLFFRKIYKAQDQPSDLEESDISN